MTMGSDARFPVLGRRQRLALGMLADHGYWQPGVPWGIGSDSDTRRALDSLVLRGMAAFERENAAHDDRWVLAVDGWSWLLSSTSLGLRGLSSGSDAADAVLNRIAHLAALARLSRDGPVNWKGERA
jgi:hypothetical protein